MVTPEAVFVYGTLMPGRSRWATLAPFAVAEAIRTDTVRGRLYRTPYGWPAAVMGGAPGRVAGVVVPLSIATADQALEILDAVEGVASGLFTRVGIVTESGTSCWTYHWPGDIDGFVEIERFTGG